MHVLYMYMIEVHQMHYTAQLAVQKAVTELCRRSSLTDYSAQLVVEL